MEEKPRKIWTRSLGRKGKWVLYGLIYILLLLLSFVFLASTPQGNHDELFWLAVPLALLACLVLLVLGLFARWVCHWRNFRWLLVGIVGLVTLVFLAYAVENWRGKRAWQAHRRSLEAQGEQLDLMQLVPPPVPDEQNFAMTPLLKPALDYERGPGGVVWRDTNAYARLNNVSIDLPDKNKTNTVAIANLEKGTFTDLPACAAFYRGHPDYPQSPEPGKPAMDVLVALGKYDAEMKELHEAAATRPYSRFPIEYEYEPAWAILLPHLAAIKRFSQVAELRAMAQLDLGQSQKALDDFKLELRLGESIRDEPILISHLVRIVIVNFNLLILREGIVRHAWSDAQLQEIQKSLSSIDLLAEYKAAMRAERAFSVRSMEWMRQQGFNVDASIFSISGQSDDRLTTRVLSLMPSGWYYQNMRNTSRMFQEFSLAAVDEKARRIHPELMEKFEVAANAAHARPRPYTLFVGVLMPALGRVAQRSGRMQAWLDAGRVACALERYRLAEGKQAESLDALVPRFINAVPPDVIDGEPLRYSRKPDGGYVLYSIGWNEVDDGGEIVFRDGKKSSVDTTKGDWVWTMPAKPITQSELMAGQ